MAKRTVHPPVRIGDVFIRWTVTGSAEPKIYGGRPFKRWKCHCICGNERVLDQASLLSGNSGSCGCLNRERLESASIVHGADRKDGRTAELTAWHNMIARCHNPRSTSYERYGARGISVCDRWRFGEGGKHGFQCFFEDMGPRPSAQHSTERLDNSVGYQPDNCKWATIAEQTRNTRQNRRLTHGGRTLTVTDWAKEVPMSVKGFMHRLDRGWSVARAITTPCDVTRIAHATQRHKRE